MSSDSKGRSRCKLRFSLRALLVFTLLISVAISWLTNEIRLAIRQQPAVEHIRGLGGHATYQYQMASPQAWHSAPPLPPTYLRRFTGDVVMSDVAKVSLHSAFAGDEDLEVLASLPRLKDLRMNVRHLTDDGAKPLASLTQLRRLDLWCEQTTDATLPYLANLRQLRQLDLYHTQVTDEGLVHLHSLKNLEELKLRDTQVTPHGVASLQKALPNCEILGVKSRKD